MPWTNLIETISRSRRTECLAKYRPAQDQTSTWFVEEDVDQGPERPSSVDTRASRCMVGNFSNRHAEIHVVGEEVRSVTRKKPSTRQPRGDIRRIGKSLFRRRA